MTDRRSNGTLQMPKFTNFVSMFASKAKNVPNEKDSKFVLHQKIETTIHNDDLNPRQGALGCSQKQDVTNSRGKIAS